MAAHFLSRLLVRGMRLGRPVSVRVTVISNKPGFSIVTKVGVARSSLASNYYTRIKPHMTVLPMSPTVKGFTAK